MASGGRNRSTLPNVPAVRVNTPLSWQCRVTAATASRFGSRVPGIDQFGGDHRTAAPDVADDVGRRGDVAQLAKHDLADGLCAGEQLTVLDFVEHPERGGAGDGVAAVRAADSAGVGGVHDVGAAGDRGQRQVRRPGPWRW